MDKSIRNILISAFVPALFLGGGIYGYHAYHVYQQQVLVENQKKQKQKEIKYYKTHFGKKITVYGVDISNLTFNQAYQKINKQAPNCLILENGKLHEAKVKDGQPIISRKQLKQIFKKNHTTKSEYQHQRVVVNQDLQKARNKLLHAKNNKVQFTVDKETYTVTANVYKQIKYYHGKYTFVGTKPVSDFINRINRKYATLDKKYMFHTPDHRTVKVQNQSYGWKINSDKLISAIQHDLINNQGNTVLNIKKYLVGREFIPTGTGFIFSNNGLGDNYVAVSIAKQKVWIIRNGKVKVVIPDVVTGTNNAGNRTPKGVWYIGYKQSPSVLKGQNDDGSPYASPVQFWMPFTETGCGFHDANWRTDWSKTAYLSNGSHGCVNVRPAEIKSVWNNVYQGMPVVIY